MTRPKAANGTSANKEVAGKNTTMKPRATSWDGARDQEIGDDRQPRMPACPSTGQRRCRRPGRTAGPIERCPRANTATAASTMRAMAPRTGAAGRPTRAQVSDMSGPTVSTYRAATARAGLSSAPRLGASGARRGCRRPMADLAARHGVQAGCERPISLPISITNLTPTTKALGMLFARKGSADWSGSTMYWTLGMTRRVGVTCAP